MLSPSSVECGIRNALEAWKDHLSGFVTASTITVAVGVALEGVEFIHDICAYIGRKRFEKRDAANLKELARFSPIGQSTVGSFRHSEWLTKLERWAKRFGRLGLILVVIGVVGEWRYGAKLEDAQNALHKLDIAELTAAEREAGDAAKSAKAAHDEADAAQKSSDKALKTSNAAIEAAGRGLGKAEAVAKRAEQVDAELAQAEFLMSARYVQNRDALSSKLTERFKNREVFLRSYVGDQEAWGLCTELWYVTHSAEMNPVDECGRAQLEVPMASPLVVSGPDIKETLDIGGMLATVGRVSGGVISGIKAPRLTIFVGDKSPFRIGQARGVKAPTKKQTKKQNAKP